MTIIDPQGDPDLDPYPARPSQLDDTTTYIDIISKAATFHKVHIHIQQDKDVFLVETLSSSQRMIQFLNQSLEPGLKSLRNSSADNFKEPVKARVVTPQIQKYKSSLHHTLEGTYHQIP